MTIDDQMTEAGSPGPDRTPSLGSTPTVRGGYTVRSFRVGEVILGRYRVTGELGRGGMGVVYRCFDEVGGIDVALKALPPELSRDSGEMEEVRDNFRLVQGLSHPNIAAIKTLERDASGDYYLIMECVEGLDLRRWRKKKGGKLPLSEVLPILRQAAAALDYAHSQKIVHRDVKPSNIMVASGGTVKVLDFGLAAQIHTSLSRVSMVRHGTSGTGPYMAPEQWRGWEQDARTDQYALAVTAYELLAGRLPFENPDPAVLREAVLKEPPRPVPGLEKKTWQILSRPLAKDPAGRFGGCSDFVRALETGKAGPPRSRAGRRKSSGRKVLTALLILAVAGGIGLGVRYGLRALDEASRRKQEMAQVSREHRERIAELLNSARAAAAAGDLERADGDLSEILRIEPGHQAASALLRETQNKVRERTAREAKVDAGLDRERLLDRDLDTGQGFAELLDQINRHWLLGEEAYGQGLWGEAYSDYREVVRLVKETEDREEKRDAARREKEALLAARREAEGAGAKSQAKELWNEAGKESRAADELFEAGNFEPASEKFRSSAAAYGRAGQRARQVADYNRAREDYQAAEKRADIQLLDQYGGDVWREVRRLSRLGDESAADPVQGEETYRAALEELPGAIRAAEAAGKKAAYETALTRARNLEREGKWNEAETAVQEALKSGWTETAAAAALLDRIKKHLGPQPGESISLDLGGGVNLELVWIKPGDFMMGSPRGEEGRLDREDPQHRVEISRGFWMGKYPVTQEQYQKIMGTNPSRFKGNSRLPVEQVTWNDAKKLCENLNRNRPDGTPEGYAFRLPTEAEWEYACRAGTTTPFHFGVTISTDQANYDGNYTYGNGRKGTYRRKTTPVGSFPPNAWGLYDMHGNVWEWCQSLYKPYPYQQDDGREDLNAGGSRVLRGGSWGSSPRYLRSADRSSSLPGRTVNYVGFRVVLAGR